jgi:hypothetical protein
MATTKLKIVENPYGTSYKSPCEPGSEEQQLDMCESGPLRGDNLLRDKGENLRFAIDVSEENREGDEMSGDDHSGGWQGDDEEWLGQLQEDGMPGDENRVDEVRAKRDHIPDEID